MPLRGSITASALSKSGGSVLALIANTGTPSSTAEHRSPGKSSTLRSAFSLGENRRMSAIVSAPAG
ncbi:MAG TPA: hypothetical protein VLE97_04325 [Gaiellaceae bacterium]|nr:hypothetical protein [Gaiellaceae bacterium]